MFVFYWLFLFLKKILTIAQSLSSLFDKNYNQHYELQDTFDVMTTILVTDYCCTALYLAIPQAHIINIITWLIRLSILKWR